MELSTGGLPDLYTPLDQGTREIRLLRVAPYEGDDVFAVCKCTMVKVSLLSSPKYNAFSYVWGDATQKEVIIVNGHRMEVTKNLVALLTRYRNIAKTIPHWTPMELPLWIDAICIHQTNVTERNIQVQLMGSIYQSAATTFSWLGESEDGSDDAMVTLLDITTKIQAAQDDSMAWMEPGQTNLWKQDPDRKASFGNQFWTSAGAMLDRPYWHRAWIVQEIVLPESVIIFCGRNILPLASLLIVYTWMVRIQGKPKPPFVDSQVWQLLSTKVGRTLMGWEVLRSYFQFKALRAKQVAIDDAEQHMRWKHLVLQTRLKQATDPRDNLYSLLGLLSCDIRPEYSASAETVFCDFAKKSIEVEGQLSLLTHAGHWELSQTLPSYRTTQATNLFVPTWVPNWDRLSKITGFTWLLEKDDMENGNDADRGWDSVLDGQPPWSLDGNTLIAQGVCCDVIASSQTCGLEDGSWLSFCLDFVDAQQDRLYPSGIPVMQALARLLSRDRKFTDGSLLEPLPNAKVIFGDVLPGFLAALYRYPDAGNVRERLGIGGVAMYEKFMGQPIAPTQSNLDSLDGLRTMAEGLKLDLNAHWASFTSDMMSHLYETGQRMREHVGFMTSKGYIGWGHKGLQDGDLVCVLFGCEMPVVLRKVDSHYLHIGPCFALGLMRGEAVSWAKAGTEKIQSFSIV
ncbi:hypothetical protein ACJ41O_015051 [Fusarium nematophilum]